MSFRELFKQTLNKYTDNATTLVIYQELIRFLNYDVMCALFLSQLIYWSDKTKNSEGWIYKTKEEWGKEIGITSYKVDLARRVLGKMGIISTKLKKANGNPTVHYKLNKEVLLDQITAFLASESTNSNNPNEENTDSLTKTTTKNTTVEINKIDNGVKSDDVNSKGCRLFLVEPDYVHKQLIEYTLNCFYCTYDEVKNQNHPSLKEKQLKRIYFELNEFIKRTGVDEADIYGIIEGWFYGDLETDHNLNHFATEGILQNRYLEKVYR